MLERLLGEKGSVRQMFLVAAAGGLAVAGALAVQDRPKPDAAVRLETPAVTHADLFVCARATAPNPDGTRTGYIFTDDGRRIPIFDPLGQEHELHTGGNRHNPADGTMDGIASGASFTVALVSGQIAAAREIVGSEVTSQAEMARRCPPTYTLPGGIIVSAPPSIPVKGAA